MDLDLRIFDEDRYVEATLYLVQVWLQPYSRHDWHWRIPIAHRFGHGTAPQVVHGTFKLLDDVGIAGEFAVRGVRTGRAEVTQMWGRPESVRQEFRKLRSQ
jgi:hypothetical protein